MPKNIPSVLKDNAIIRKDSNKNKISEALGELVKPYIEDDMSLSHIRSLVGVGAIAWNLALNDGPPLEDVNNLIDNKDLNTRALFDALISDLINRKLKLFPEDERLIAGWEVSQLPDGRFLIEAAGAGFE